MRTKYLYPFALILILVLAACGGQQTAEPSAAAASQPAADTAANAGTDGMQGGHDETMAESSDEMGEMAAGHEDTMDGADGAAEMAMEGEDGSMAASSAAMMELPLWQTLAVINAATGEPLSLGDFKGKTVFVEPMATWCSNCRAQQGNVREAKAQLGDDVVFVGLSLETTLPAESLARYAQDNGFDWTYAVMSEELLAGLVDEFGRSITSAPSTPHFIIRPDGSFSELSTGIHAAEEIIAQVQEAQS
jgi:thiol-disulfide isomerase/thioredoxin